MVGGGGVWFSTSPRHACLRIIPIEMVTCGTRDQQLSWFFVHETRERSGIARGRVALEFQRANKKQQVHFIPFLKKYTLHY